MAWPPRPPRPPESPVAHHDNHAFFLLLGPQVPGLLRGSILDESDTTSLPWRGDADTLLQKRWRLRLCLWPEPPSSVPSPHLSPSILQDPLLLEGFSLEQLPRPSPLKAWCPLCLGGPARWFGQHSNQCRAPWGAAPVFGAGGRGSAFLDVQFQCPWVFETVGCLSKPPCPACKMGTMTLSSQGCHGAGFSAVHVLSAQSCL